MKHLFRLALKYVTRQKLRTALMFLSVALSVFVLNTFLVYTSSTIRSIRNAVVEENGEWEANISGVLDACANGESETVKSAAEAAEIISDHVAVDKYYLYVFDSYEFGIMQDPSGPVGFFDIELDNGYKSRVTNVFRSTRVGNLERGSHNWFDPAETKEGLAPDEIVAPKWIQDAGYEVGDTITITVTPEMGTLDENAEPMLTIRKKLAEMNAESDEFYYVIDGEEVDNTARNGRRLSKMSLISLIDTYSDMSTIELKDRELSSPVTFTAKIAAFDTSDFGSSKIRMWLSTAFDTTVDLSPLKDSPLPFNRDNRGVCHILTNPNTPFEYNMELLLKDLGFTDKDAYDDFRYAMHGYGIELNTPYMLTSFRSIDGIGKAVPYIGAYLILLLIVWFFSRFIIDNAFEISVQERSVQFAALRVMGASKGQLATLVFTEGLFYALTALPLGMVTSALACRYVFSSLNSIGFDVLEFYASPVTLLICAALCLAGIFISTYTSAMWASRKLSPVEALNYGKPKSKKMSKRKHKEKKSRLNLSSKRFMVRYTFKNILRTKRRFLISSVAMGLGVLIFTICLQLGASLYVELREEIDLNEPRSDFYVHTDALRIDDIEKEVMDSGYFSYAKYQCHAGAYFERRELEKLGRNNLEAMSAMGSGSAFGYPVNINTMNKGEFEYKLESLADFNSTVGEDTGKTGVGLVTAEVGENRPTASYADVLGMSYEEFEAMGKPVLLLPQRHHEDSTDYGYGYEAFSEPMTFTDAEKGIDIEIAGIAHCGYNNVILMPMSYAKELLNSGMNMYANMYLTVRDSDSYPAAKKALNSVLTESDTVYDEFKTGTGLLDFIKTIVEIAVIFMLSIWLCGIVSMMNTINTSALNRSRELLMMRAVGMTRRQLTGTVVLESLLFSAVSAVGGTLVSVVGYQLIMRFVLERTEFHFGVITLVISAALNVVIAFIAALPAVRTLNHSVSK
ncbi:MAG: ABC transporter permease [Ruminococcus sp.]|nr:ABC transporter permease [Ruminococcus sp.]